MSPRLSRPALDVSGRFFDRPLRTDPLWWFGIVGGVVGSVFYGLGNDLGVWAFTYQLVIGVTAFTWWVAGLLLSTIRYYFRLRGVSTDERSAT